MSQEHDPEPDAITQPEPGMCWGPKCKRPAVTEWFCSATCYENWTRLRNKTSDCNDRPNHDLNVDRYIESPYRSYTEWRNAQRGVEDDDEEEDCE